jgi:hypothetical protein
MHGEREPELNGRESYAHEPHGEHVSLQKPIFFHQNINSVPL